MHLCVRRPSDALDAADAAERIPRAGGCGRCNAASGLPPRSLGSRTPYRGTGAAGAQSSAGVAGRRDCPTWLSPLSCRDGWRRSPRGLGGRRVDRSGCGASCLACRDPSDWGLFAPPQRRLDHNAVQRLPAPLDAQEFIVPGQQPGTQPLEDPGLDPRLEAAVARGAGPIFPRQGLPLAARTEHVQDAIHDLAEGTTGRPGVLGGFSGGRSGWSSTQRSSGMRQIVRSRRFVLRCVFIGGNLCCDEGAITDHTKYTTDMLAV